MCGNFKGVVPTKEEVDLLYENQNKEFMDCINKMLAQFYGEYRNFLQSKNNFNENELDRHIDKFCNRFYFVVNQGQTREDFIGGLTTFSFRVKRKKGMKKTIFAKYYKVEDFS